MKLDVTNLSSFDVQLKKFAALIGAEVGKVRDKVGVEIYRGLIMDSPVDQGRFRASWNMHYVTPDTEVKPEGEHGMPSVPVISSPFPFEALFITNSLPYAVRLNEGWSKQAPKNFVENNVQKAQQSILSML